jgi:hypothetical protein
MWEYKIAQEFIGSDQGNDYIQDTKTRNFDSEYLPQDIKKPVINSNKTRLNKCEICHRDLVDSEFQNRYLEDGTEIYKCNTCKHTNDPYKRKIQKGKNRLKKRRSSSEKMIKEAIGNSNSNVPGLNPANQPWGRLDLTNDERIIPWNRIEDGFREEFDHQKQKKNFKYKLVKKKKEDGKYQFIRVKIPETGGEAIQPSNVYDEKGRVKKQPRYNPEKNRNKNKSDGSWPHNRNPGTEGWYGQEYGGGNLDADLRQRVIPWNEYISDRSSFMTNLSRPL